MGPAGATHHVPTAARGNERPVLRVTGTIMVMIAVGLLLSALPTSIEARV
ncbi:MAG: hypothetical protein ACREDK_00165 [Thermoplasmata archaeon]